ncbi:MAG: hypothetical protein HOO96_03570 [Polyangiaceae bacterium]|nr:hypothetical protein [Polyangiaceae bacterium]
MIPALLVGLALVDLAFAAFRDAAGRDGRIRKRAFYIDAVVRGTAIGAALVALLGALTAAVVMLGPPGTYADLVRIGGRMVLVYGTYATLVLATLGVYFVGSGDVRAFATVAVLGPFTWLRVPVVLAGALWASLAPAEVPAARPWALVATFVCAVAVATAERAFGWLRALGARAPRELRRPRA